MRNKKKALKVISEKLKGIPWAIFAGMAVEVYTNGKRKGKDIDIIVPGDKIDEVAKRFNATPVLETREKGNIKIVNDYHIEIMVGGVPVEFVGKTEKIVIDSEEYQSTKDLRRKLFKKVKKKKYLDVDVFVVPIEEILVQKLLYHHSGKWQDIEDIKLLLQSENVSKKALINAFDRWGVSKEKQNTFIQKVSSLANF